MLHSRTKMKLTFQLRHFQINVFCVVLTFLGGLLANDGLAQTTPRRDTIFHEEHLFNAPYGFVEAGVINELWIVNKSVGAATTSMTYRGPGTYIGFGGTTDFGKKKQFYLRLGVYYWDYSLTKTYSELEQSNRHFSFLALAPSLEYLFLKNNTIRITGGVSINYLMAMQNQQQGGVSFGPSATIMYKAFELKPAFRYAQGSCPDQQVAFKNWTEESFTLGVAVYPFLLPAVQKHKTGKLW